jgi:hypothetical protein
MNDDKKSTPEIPDKHIFIKESIDKGIDAIKYVFSAKYSHDKTGLYIYLSIVFILTASITSLAIWTDIDFAVTGALLGSLIGFSFGNFPKSNRGDKRE